MLKFLLEVMVDQKGVGELICILFEPTVFCKSSVKISTYDSFVKLPRNKIQN